MSKAVAMETQAERPAWGPTVEQELADIERALDILLRAAIEADGNRPPRAWKAPEVFNLTMLGEAAKNPAYDIVANPLGEAARRAIKPLGQRLHMLGGTALMRDVSYRVADMDPSHDGRRLSIMDARWNGVGCDTGDVWWS
jgi:hypothetical protein